MILAYFPRLLCLSLAAFFLVHLGLATMVSMVARRAVTTGERLAPHTAARLLLFLRLFPAAGASVVVAVVCLPSYLLIEPEAPNERVGYLCIAVALLGTSSWVVSITRGLRAAAGSRRFLESCERAGHRAHLAWERADTWIVDGAGPLLAIAGIIHPRLVISRGVVRALTTEQLGAALRHERAHFVSRDNLKRLCILMVPGFFPFAGSSRTLERGWRKFAEWAADDRAVAGNTLRAFALAGALVRVARLTGAALDVPWAAMLLGEPDQLSARVERLLRPRPVMAARRKNRILPVAAMLTIAASLATAILLPAALYSIHQALEHLVE